VATGVALLTAGLAACGSSAPATPPSSATGSAPGSASSPAMSAGTATSAAATSAAATSAAATSAQASAVGSGASAAAGTPTTLTGTITEGVESGCLVLTDEAGAVLANLIGIDPATVTFEVTVEVTGKFQPDMMTTCQQGSPFAVATVQPK